MPDLKRTTLIVMLLITVITLIIVILPGMRGEATLWGGTDDAAVNKIGELNAGYKPWISPVWKPGGMESFLFSLQAAIGAGIIGYMAGFYTARKKGDN